MMQTLLKSSLKKKKKSKRETTTGSSVELYQTEQAPELPWIKISRILSSSDAEWTVRENGYDQWMVFTRDHRF